MKKSFHVGDVLSASTGVLCSPEKMGGVYNILNFLTGDQLFTHQLPAASRIAEPYLRAQFPWLDQTEPPDFSTVPAGDDRDRAVDEWVGSIAAQHGEWLEVEALPPDAWGTHSPLADLAAAIGSNGASS